jgi:hypothetical protein
LIERVEVRHLGTDTQRHVDTRLPAFGLPAFQITGDRIPITAAKKYGVTAIGFEINAELIKQSREKAEAAGVADRVRFHQDDPFNADLSKIDVLTLYLYPVQNRKLLPRLKKLETGVRVVTHRYGLPGVRPDETQRIKSSESDETHTIYMYTTPLVFGDSTEHPASTTPKVGG